ncbi:hypothetical protein EHQ24_03110 [Leptospira noumeaensis]|uniref:Uncharacterized protein n=1 Tax=Leptospira noumeaensis TaxID=2484964 RepID=A0A4R9IGV4_9LEPT|nr:hypothetical protein [Leptospira noumeaensis]TGK87196.1 hypothetical protein EHQ24_03110 [Leptospira noumeaensis]
MCSIKNNFLNNVDAPNKNELHIETTLSPTEKLDHSNAFIQFSYYKDRSDKKVILFLEKRNQNITVPESLKFKCDGFNLKLSANNPDSRNTGQGRNKTINESLRTLQTIEELKQISLTEKCKVFIYGRISTDSFYLKDDGLLLLRKFVNSIEIYSEE